MILDQRKNPKTDSIEYLVKCKDFDETENEWVPEELFDSVDLFNEYNNAIHRKDQTEVTSPIEKPKKKRGPKSPSKYKGLPHVLSLLCFIF